jgi:hypothetical protein
MSIKTCPEKNVYDTLGKDWRQPLEGIALSVNDNDRNILGMPKNLVGNAARQKLVDT